MINYSIKKPHPFCGHFVKINNEAEYNQIREIAEGCGFGVCDYSSKYPLHQFCNNMECESFHESTMSGQEITLSELRQLAELSKIELPCEMEVWDDENEDKLIREVVDFYKGQPVDPTRKAYQTWKYFKIPNHRKAEIQAKIKEHQEAIEKLTKEMEGEK